MLASSSIIGVLLTLPAATKCFLQTNSNFVSFRRNGHDGCLGSGGTGMQDDCISQINDALAAKRQELLSDKSKHLLKELHPQSTIPEDNELRGQLTDEVMIREVLLSSRLDLPFLNRTRVGPSTIEGAGRGLFATEDIAEGEAITCYPGDLLLCEVVSPEGEDGEDDFYDFEAVEDGSLTECVALWGNHVPMDDRWDDDAVFDGTESKPALTSYALSVNDIYSIMGHPSLDDNPAYSGHFANDGAGSMALAKPNSPEMMQASLELGLDTSEEGLGVEDNIAAYVLKSFEVANAMHKCPDDDESHIVTVATRDIKEGDEIMGTYGPDFWANQDIQ